jgi:osmotically-inducible protein OsmY
MPQSDTGTSASGSASAESSSLQTQIDAALKKEPTLSNSNVVVNVTDSAVELSGSVATGKEKQTAKRIAQSFAGNRRVEDKITVTGQGSSSTTPPSGTSTTQPDQTTPKH